VQIFGKILDKNLAENLPNQAWAKLPSSSDLDVEIERDSKEIVDRECQIRRFIVW
jgi:hypothetical protein